MENSFIHGSRLWVLVLSLILTSCAYAVPVAKVAEEPVFPASEAPCAENDRADAPAHAFRDAEGKVQLIATSNKNRRQIGQSLNSLKRDCSIVFEGAGDRDFNKHNNEGWLHGSFTEDGKTIYSLVHNEYWGHKIYPECKNYTSCWRNDITWAKSSDGGKTYHSPPANKRLVAGFSYPYEANLGRPAGFMNPSNIIAVDGYLYAFIRSMGLKKQSSGNFLIRIPRDEKDWSRWQIWDGSAFSNIRELMKAGGAVGKPIQVGKAPGFPNASPMNVLSVVRHVSSGQFVATMARGSRLAFKDAEKGFYISTSTNLINWSEPRQIAQAKFECNKAKSGPQSFYRYYSMLDPTSTDRNFATTGDNPYIYTTKITVQDCKKFAKQLELVRIPVTLNMSSVTN